MDCVPHALFRIAREAGRTLAAEDAAVFWAQTADLRNHSSPVVQHLLIEIYVSLGVGWADAALQWLLDDPTRLEIGTGSHEPEWMPAARLIEYLSPHCSDTTFRTLEEEITHYRTPNERRDAKLWLSTWRNGYFGDYWGRAQHFLLPALYKERRSVATEGLIGVLQRKFSEYPPERFYRDAGVRFGSVGSTLRGESLERISDKAWLRIVANKCILEDGTRRDRWVGNHWEESSVFQFSSNLRSVASRFPERFARLALRFPVDVNSHYKAAILSGCQQTQPGAVPEAERALWHLASAELVAEVLRKFLKDDSDTYALEFCRLIQSRADETWPDSAINRLLDYACNHPNPAVAELVVGNPGGGFELTKATVATLLTNAINCVRGAAGAAMQSLVRRHTGLLDKFADAITRMVQDPHPAVRIAAVEVCNNALWIDKDKAIKWFCAACADDLRVAASPAAVDFFNCGMQSHYAVLAPIVRGMLKSEHEEVAREGAKEVAARWLFHGFFSEEFEECLRNGTVPQKKGLAHIAACLVTETDYFDKCARMVDMLKNDPNNEVRRELNLTFRKPDVMRMPNGVDLALRFISSEAFRDDPTTLIYRLMDYAGNILPFKDVVLSMCEEFAGPLRESSRDPSGGVMWDTSHFFPLVMRLYEQATDCKDFDTVNRCLDAWDAMFEKRVGVVQELAKVID